MKCHCGNTEFVQDEFITNINFEKSDDGRILVRQDTVPYYFCKSCGLMYFGPIFEKKQGVISEPDIIVDDKKVDDEIEREK